MASYEDAWRKFLDPEALRNNLISISLYIAAFEMFKEQVVEKPRTYFSEGFDQSGLIIGDDYKDQVLALDKSRVKASLLWFREMGALANEDISRFDELRRYRNQLAHEMAQFIGSSERTAEPERFDELLSLFSKLEKWWFKEFELALQAEAMPDGADPDEVVPGQIWFIHLMRDIALGLEPSEGYYYSEYQKLKT